MSAAPHNKGLAFNSCVRQLRALTAPAELERVVAALPAETRALVERPPLPIEWLPYVHTFTLIRAAHDLVFGGDENYEGMQHATPLFWAMQVATIEGLVIATGLGPAQATIVEGKKSPSRCVVEVTWG